MGTKSDGKKARAFTLLADKHASPMIIRKSTKWGFPVYVALITDDDLSSLDETMVAYMEDNPTLEWASDIQKIRNIAGGFVELLLQTYKKTEGAAVIVYADKMFVSSLHGDFMTHQSCKIELFSLLQMSAHV